MVASWVALLSALGGASAWSVGCARVTRTAVRAAVRLDQAAPQGRVGMADGPQQRISAEETYRVMFKTLLETENPIADEVSKNYALFDYGFMTRLEKMQAEVEAGSPQSERLAEVSAALSAEMSRRMGEAAETLRMVLQSPSAIVMEGKMAGLARQGKIDDALLQLLEANLQQAKAAGEAGAAAVAALTKLQARVQEEVDKKVPPDVQLLRRLLRMDSKPARMELLKEKMSPKQRSQLVIAGSVSDATKTDLKTEDTAPEIDPRALAQAFTNLKARFGNVDESYDTGFMKKVEAIAEEAEEVALEIAGGKEITAREQQDMMWERGTVSVWDLEQVENQAHEQGGYAVWEKEGQDLMQKDMQQRMKGLQQDGDQ